MEVFVRRKFDVDEEACEQQDDGRTERVHQQVQVVTHSVSQGMLLVIGANEGLTFAQGHGDMELRHQRNPDVVEYPSLETKDDVEGMRSEKPMEYVYNMIETLLPEANFNSTTGKGRMLEM